LPIVDDAGDWKPFAMVTEVDPGFGTSR
jgi:hypothetical protein